jgi:hypothetical protein
LVSGGATHSIRVEWPPRRRPEPMSCDTHDGLQFCCSESTPVSFLAHQMRVRQRAAWISPCAFSVVRGLRLRYRTLQSAM